MMRETIFFGTKSINKISVVMLKQRLLPLTIEIVFKLQEQSYKISISLF